MKKSKGRILSAFLALCTFVSAIPVAIYAEELEIKEWKDAEQDFTIVKYVDPPTTGEDIFDTFMANTDVDLGDNVITPMGDKPVTLYEASELFTYKSKDSGVQSSTGFYDVSLSDGSYNNHTTYYFDESNQRSIANLSELDDLCFAQGVAFDPTACGRRNYVAILGFHNTQNKNTSAVYVYIINGDTRKVVSKYTLDSGNLWWLVDDKGNLLLDNVDSANFFQITAGDYDNDGKDTLVVYDGTPKLRELKINVNDNTGAVSVNKTDNIITDNTPYLNKSYMNTDASGNVMYNSGIIYRANVSLETGDLNGDGIDDLAVVSCVGDYNEKQSTYYKNKKNEPCIAAVAVGFGKINGTLQSASVSYHRLYDSNTNMTVAAPDLSIGDIDGDGNNELVVAGFLNKSTADDKVNFQKGKVGFTYYKASGTNMEQYGGFQTLNDISANSKGDSLREKETLWQQFSVECVSFDGLHTQDYIFLNGYVYKLNTNKVPEHISIKGNSTDKELFAGLTNKWSPYSGVNDDYNEVYIASAAVGNFNNSETGEESILLTVGYKLNGKNQYSFTEVLVEKRNGKLVFSIDKTGAPVSEGFTMTTNDFHKEEGKSGMSYIHITVDIDYDSCVAQYMYNEAFYSDPTVIAFLQAAPYFAELEAGNSSTQYSYTETYENSTGSGYEFAVGVGITAEIETSAVKFKVDEAVSTGISQEFTNSLSQEYTTTFEANDQNQVVLRRMLICTYYYAIQGKDGTYHYENPDDFLAITVPQNPCISTLNLDQYNMYVEYYNQQFDKYSSAYSNTNYFNNKLVEITDKDLLDKYYISDNEGNPYGYAPSISSYANSVTMVKDNTWITLGHAGGTTTQEYSYTQGIEKTECSSAGVEVNMELMAGASFAGNGAYAGVTSSMSYVTQKTKTTSELKTIGTGGTVQNLSSDQTDYDFQWQLIGWKMANGDNLFNNDVLFIGYAVKNVKSLPQPVDELSLTYPDDDGNIVLTWTSPEISKGRVNIDEFYIYQDGVSIGSVKNTGEKAEHSYTVDVSGISSAKTTFYVLSSAKVQSGSTISNLYSIPSNTVECILALNQTQVKELINQTISQLNKDISDLKKLIDTKASTEELAEAIEKINASYKDADLILSAEIDGLEKEIADLNQEMNDAHDVLYEAITTVQENLDKAVEDLNKAVSEGDTKNAEDLAKAISDLTTAYKSADELIKTDVSSLKDEVENLKNSVSQADESLKQAIEKVQENLDKAVEDLNKAVSEGDTKNAEDLAKAISDLTTAYKSADELIKTDVSSLKDEVENLKNSVSQADESLKQAITTVQENLDKAVKDLNKAVSDGDTKNAEDLAKAISDLTTAYKSADELIKTDVSSLKDEVENLKNSVSQADESLKQAIEKVQENLDKAIEELNKAISEGNIQNAQEIAESALKLVQSYKETEELLNDEIKNLKEDLKLSKENYYAEIQELKTLVESLQSELTASNDASTLEIETLKEQISQLEITLNTEVENSNTEIGNLESEISYLKSEIESLKAEIEEIKNVNAQQTDRNNQLTTENQNQAEDLKTLKTVATVGFGVSVTSLLANVVLIIVGIIRRKNSVI